jgi:hypothetical protein
VLTPVRCSKWWFRFDDSQANNVFGARIPGVAGPNDLRDDMFLAAIAAETRTALR